jgi:hypothetical protein
MDERIHKLEIDVAVMNTKLATLATKEDLQKAINDATSKYVGWMFVIFATFTGVVTAIKFLWH